MVVGFILLVGTGFWFEADDIDVFANAYDSVPQQQTFTRKDVQEHLGRLFERMHYRRSNWLAVSGLVMLGGGLMLFKRPRLPAKPTISKR